MLHDVLVSLAPSSAAINRIRKTKEGKGFCVPVFPSSGVLSLMVSSLSTCSSWDWRYRHLSIKSCDMSPGHSTPSIPAVGHARASGASRPPPAALLKKLPSPQSMGVCSASCPRWCGSMSYGAGVVPSAAGHRCDGGSAAGIISVEG